MVKASSYFSCVGKTDVYSILIENIPWYVTGATNWLPDPSRRDNDVVHEWRYIALIRTQGCGNSNRRVQCEKAVRG